MPFELTRAVGTNVSGISAFYTYDRGGFIDREWLWRIDANPETIARTVTGLGLHPSTIAPPAFWRMPPHYWPRSMPPNSEMFQSPAFVAETRGPDGPHYYMVYDKAQQRAFVWFKSNF